MENNQENKRFDREGSERNREGRRPRIGSRPSGDGSPAYRSGNNRSSYGDRQPIRDERSSGNYRERSGESGDRRPRTYQGGNNRYEGGNNRYQNSGEGGYNRYQNNREGGNSRYQGNADRGNDRYQGNSDRGNDRYSGGGERRNDRYQGGNNRYQGNSDRSQGGNSRYQGSNDRYSRNNDGQRSYRSNDESGQERTRRYDGEQRSYDRPRRSDNQQGYSPRGGDRNNDRGGYQGNNRSYGGDRQGSFGKPFRKFEQRNDSYNPNDKYSKRKQIEYKQQYIDYTQPMRLNKYMANAGLCSRREADEFIQAGVVTVNGEVVTELGTKITPATDKVLFHDQLVRTERKVYILLNKPKDCVTTAEDTHARLTVLDLVKNACSERIYPVGRLDRNTTGVLLITNDGDLTSKLTHPKYDKKKIYHVVLDRDLEREDFDKLATGITLEDGEIKADEISYINDDDHKQVGIEIHSGKNRIVRRMFDQLGYRVMRLDRVYFAGLTKKNLPRGKWRYLSEAEVNMLKMST